MSYHLARRAVLKWLETPSVYQIARDELYELDSESFRFMRDCATQDGCTSKDGAFVDFCMEEGLLTTEKFTVRRPILKHSPAPSLRYLELQITDACNLRCRHCYLGSGSGNELSVAQVRAALAEFEELQGLRVLITGGEPLMHRKFDEINEMLPDFFLRKVLFTNGLLLKNGVLKTLKVDEIQISIDGMEQAHDSLRGKGTFARSMEAVRNALDAGFAVSISTMVHPGNLADFDALERLFKDLGIKDWTVDIPAVAGWLKENADLIVTPEQSGKYLAYGYGGGLHASTRGHGCGFHLMALMADGKLAKCTFYGDRAVGSLDQGLLAAWSKIQPVLLRDLACKCEFLDVCRGGCRYRAELTTGKRGKDLYRCALYGILEKDGSKHTPRDQNMQI